MGLWVSKGTPNVPRSLGGSQDLYSFPLHFPVPAPAFPVGFYFLVEAGHHLERCVALWRHEKHHEQFWKMNFHHLFTVMIMAVACVGGMLAYGISLLQLLNLMEPLMNLCKVFCEIDFLHFLLVPTYVLFVLVRLLSRIVAYAVEILMPVNLGYFYINDNLTHFGHINLFEVVCINALQVLNFFEVVCINTLQVLNLNWF
jgi:TLC domain